MFNPSTLPGYKQTYSPSPGQQMMGGTGGLPQYDQSTGTYYPNGKPYSPPTQQPSVQQQLGQTQFNTYASGVPQPPANQQWSTWGSQPAQQAPQSPGLGGNLSMSSMPQFDWSQPWSQTAQVPQRASIGIPRGTPMFGGGFGPVGYGPNWTLPSIGLNDSQNANNQMLAFFRKNGDIGQNMLQQQQQMQEAQKQRAISDGRMAQAMTQSGFMLPPYLQGLGG